VRNYKQTDETRRIHHQAPAESNVFTNNASWESFNKPTSKSINRFYNKSVQFKSAEISVKNRESSNVKDIETDFHAVPAKSLCNTSPVKHTGEKNATTVTRVNTNLNNTQDIKRLTPEQVKQIEKNKKEAEMRLRKHMMRKRKREKDNNQQSKKQKKEKESLEAHKLGTSKTKVGNDKM
jgi:hypothetical protein